MPQEENDEKRKKSHDGRNVWLWSVITSTGQQRSDDMAGNPEKQSHGDTQAEREDRDILALAGWIQSELDAAGWVKINDESTQNTLWASPERLRDILREEATILTEEQVDQRLIKAVIRQTPELEGTTLNGDSYLAEVKTRLDGRYDWRTIRTTAATKWYDNASAHSADIKRLTLEFQDIVDHPHDATETEYQAALVFFASNAYSVIEEFGASSVKIENAMNILRGSAEYARESVSLFQATAIGSVVSIHGG